MLDNEVINLILLAALAVNLRMAMYAAALAAHRNWIFEFQSKLCDVDHQIRRQP